MRWDTHFPDASLSRERPQNRVWFLSNADLLFGI